MALNVTLMDEFTEDDSFVRIFKCTGDSSYPTGGYPFTAATFGMNTFYRASVPPNNGTYPDNGANSVVEMSCAGAILGDFLAFDYTNGKIAFFAAAGTQKANASNQTAFTFYLEVRGH